MNASSHIIDKKYSGSMSFPCDFVDSLQTINLNSKATPSNHKVTIQLIKYDINQYSDKFFSQHKIEIPTDINSLSPQRKASFLAGRLAVKNAFLDLGLRPKNIKVGLHKHPIWPDNIKGSISHCNNYSIATLDSSCYTEENIGIDFQDIINNKEIKLISDTVLTKSELKFLGMDVKGWDKEEIFTLIFSAKESFFKAMYPQIKQYFNFKDVIIS